MRNLSAWQERQARAELAEAAASFERATSSCTRAEERAREADREVWERGARGWTAAEGQRVERARAQAWAEARRLGEDADAERALLDEARAAWTRARYHVRRAERLVERHRPRIRETE